MSNEQHDANSQPGEVRSNDGLAGTHNAGTTED